MRPLKTMVRSLLFSALLLTGCASQPRLLETERLEKANPPEALLTCPDSPEPPVLASQRDVADFLVALWEAGEDCRGKLAALRALFQADRPAPIAQSSSLP